MRITTHHSDWIKRRLGDTAVTVLLLTAYLLTGCSVDKGPNEQDSVADQAVVERAAGDVAYEPAEPQLEPVRTTPVTYQEAEAAYRDGHYDRAVQLFVAYTEVEPENPWGYFMLGLSARRAGDLETAEWSFEEALARDPQHVKSMLNLSRVLLDTDRPGEAVMELTFALELDSTSNVVHRLLGRGFHELGKVEDAIASYRHAIVLNGSDVWAMNNLGYLYIQRGRFTDAIGPLARAVELDSTRALFLNNLGMALERAGYVGSARDAYDQAVRYDPDHRKAMQNLARVEERGVDLDINADLTVLARAFVDEISSRRELAAGELVPANGPPDGPDVPQPEPPER
ncbi:MAG: tetratricopeptide repeat protein [Gemmatimonadales bacterium]|jgi:Flp pilus assembly protein TadD